MTTIRLQNYAVHLGNPKAAFAELLAHGQYTKIAVLTDTNTSTHCLRLWRALTGMQEDVSWVIPSGEVHKSVATCAEIWQMMLAARLDRRALIVNLGGGVIGDMGGFCAATYMRGVDFVQVPTTLLSQVDASIGSKLGIDFGGVKNSVGLFSQPAAVFVCPDFLATLAKRELRSGFAEMLKHGLIADAEQWNTLKNLDLATVSDWESMILASLEVKRNFVEADPLEHGIRKALNFGHTFGHAIEGISLETDTPLLHGEAVAIGMICEAYLSQKLAGLPQKSLDDIVSNLLIRYGKTELDKKNWTAYINLMQQDKKNSHGKILCTLLSDIGQVVVNQPITTNDIRSCLAFCADL